MSEDGEEHTGHPLWVRILIAATVLGTGAAIGGVAGESWGSALFGAVVASPIAALGFMVPNVLLGILYVLEMFSCAS